MNREILEEKAQLYALGTMPEEELGEFEDRIREDRETQALVHEYQRVVEIDLRGGRQEPPFHVYAEVMKRIDSNDATPRETETEGAPAKAGTLVSILSWSGWAAAACMALVFVLGGVGQRAERSSSDIVLNELGNPSIVQVQTPSEELQIEDRMLELANLAEAYWFSREGVPDGQLLTAENTPNSEFSEGFTIYDHKYNIGFIAVENLPREAPDKSYHVWAQLNENEPPIRAGSLPIGDESRGLFFFDLANLPEGANYDTLSFFVTEEAAELPSTPSSMIVLKDI